MHELGLKEAEQKKKACIDYTQVNSQASGIVMELHCYISEICEPPMSSFLFSVICLRFLKVLFLYSRTTINSTNLYMEQSICHVYKLHDVKL